MSFKRMRTGLAGRLLPVNGSPVLAVLYSLAGHASRGRLRPPAPDGELLLVAITLVKLPRAGWAGDDHFAEFVVRPVSH